MITSVRSQKISSPCSFVSYFCPCQPSTNQLFYSASISVVYSPCRTACNSGWRSPSVFQSMLISCGFKDSWNILVYTKSVNNRDSTPAKGRTILNIEMAKENNEICDIIKKCKILLLDIEGTTTSISFVKVGLMIYRPVFGFYAWLQEIWCGHRTSCIFFVFRCCFPLFGHAKCSRFRMRNMEDKNQNGTPAHAPLIFDFTTCYHIKLYQIPFKAILKLA